MIFQVHERKRKSKQNKKTLPTRTLSSVKISQNYSEIKILERRKIAEVIHYQ